MSHDIWHNVNRTRASYQRSAIAIVRKALNLYYAPIFARLKDDLPNDGLINSLDKEIIRQMFIDIHFLVGKKFAGGVFKSFMKKTQTFAEDVFMFNVINSIDNEGAIMIQHVDDASKAIVRRVIAQEVKRGEGIPQIALEVSKAIKVINFKRGITIARTEVIRASNSGALTGANMTGLALNKEWISTLDGRTRRPELGEGGFDHYEKFPRGADGEKVDKDDMFRGSGQALRYPADWQGSAANTINCRCTLGFKRKIAI